MKLQQLRSSKARFVPNSLELAGLLAIAVMVVSCSTTAPEFTQGKQLMEQGRVDEGLAVLELLANKYPKNPEYRTYYFSQREAVINRLLVAAAEARDLGDIDESEKRYRHVLQIDMRNKRAEIALSGLEQERRHSQWMTQAESLHQSGKPAAAREKLSEILGEDPGHRGAASLLKTIDQSAAQKSPSTPLLHTMFKKPVTLEFRDAPIKSIFDILSQSSGINFILDRDVRSDQRATITVRNTTLDEVLEILLTTNRLEKKVLNDNTILIYLSTPEKKREYQDMLFKSFYLENADSKQVAAMIKTMIKTTDVFVVEKLNLVMMRDTPEAVNLAEQLVGMQDMPEPEVTLEVEILEVGSSHLLDLGINYPGQVSYGLKGAAGPGTATLKELAGNRSGLVSLNLPNPALLVNLQHQDGDTRLLANPRIRVKNHEKAKIHIGDRVPVITTTAATGGGFVSESVNYIEVGLKLDVEPSIYLEGDVGIKVGLEVSNIVKEVSGKNSSNTLTYQIGTRNADTVLRLHDGETQILAGLISDEDRNSASKVPGLGDFPLLGRLFSSESDTRNKKEIVLLITPHVVRNIIRPSADKTTFLSGSQSRMGTGGYSGSAAIATPIGGITPPSPANMPAQPEMLQPGMRQPGMMPPEMMPPGMMPPGMPSPAQPNQP